MKRGGECPVCESIKKREVLTIEAVPAHSCILWSSKEEAINCTKGDIRLTLCDDCGHLFNRAFDPELMIYTEQYENSLHFSARFQEYSKELVERLCVNYGIYNKDILEIGCGKGDFLRMICEFSKSRGYGFDKSYEPDLNQGANLKTIKFIQDFYSEKYANYPADLVITRYVLEHIGDPYDFLSNIRKIAGGEKEAFYYFEVPNILYTIRDLGIWDLIYEHCSYFSGPSLTRLFERLDFKVMNVTESYMGQFLSIEADTANHSNQKYTPYVQVEHVRDLIRNFGPGFDQKIKGWKRKLQELHWRDKKIVVWGGGAKGVSFLNFLETTNIIRYVVDINPRKEGKYIAGTGQKYIMPEALTDIKPDVVILMNPIYKDEVSRTLTGLGVHPEILVA